MEKFQSKIQDIKSCIKSMGSEVTHVNVELQNLKTMMPSKTSYSKTSQKQQDKVKSGSNSCWMIKRRLRVIKISEKSENINIIRILVTEEMQKTPQIHKEIHIQINEGGRTPNLVRHIEA